MANKVLEKFGKYWSNFSTFTVVAVVLDPRYKIHYVQWSYKMIYGDGFEYELEFTKVKDAIRGLYDYYASSYSSSSNANLKSNASEAVTEAGDDFMTDFDSFFLNQSTLASKSEIDMYYEEPLIPRSTNIDILSYWRTCTVCYPILGQMAKDVLDVPVSIAASESAFRIGSRVLDCYRSSLKPETVEAIFCLRDSAFGEDCM